MPAILTVTMNPSIDLYTSTDKVEPVRKLRCTRAARDPGGGGVNVARVITRLGGDCAALYPAGGLSGRLLRRLLDDEGVASIAVEVSNETRYDFTVLEEESGGEFRFVLPGAPLCEDEWQACLDRVPALGERLAYIVASGSLPPAVPQDLYARLARVAADLGARMVVDTSGGALGAALEQGVHLVKPNLRELRDFTGMPLERESDWFEAAERMVRAGGAEVVALSLGHRGALLVSRDVRLRAAAIPVEVASAVGAGDSFLAGMVWALAGGRNLEEALRYGVAAGTAALLTPGTGLARPEDIARLYGEVIVSEGPKPGETEG